MTKLSIIISAIIILFFLSFVLCKKNRIDPNQFYRIELISVVFAFFGAKIFRALEILFFDNKGSDFIESIKKGGGAALGGVILGLASFYYFIDYYNVEHQKESLNIQIIVICFFHGIWKIGCYFSGCCNGVFKIPIQLIEAGVLILFTIFLLKLNKNKANISLVPIYFVFYGVGRAVIENYRCENKDVKRFTQIICYIIFSVGLLIIIKNYIRVVINEKEEK